MDDLMDGKYRCASPYKSYHDMRKFLNTITEEDVSLFIKCIRAMLRFLSLALVGGSNGTPIPMFFANNLRKTQRITPKRTVPAR